jgi:hypothetical protein
VRYFARCIKAAQASPSCHYHMGLAQSALGDNEGARRSLGQAIAVEKNGPFAALAQRALATMAPEQPASR